MSIHRPILVVLVMALASPRCCMAESKHKGLVGQWEFAEGRDSHIHDTSGRGNDGLSTAGKWIELVTGYGLEFAGGTGRVNCGRGASLDIRGPVSLAVWIFPTAPASSETGIAGKSFTSYGLTYYTDGKAYWYINDGGNKASAPVRVKDWSHVVGTFDGKHLRIYVNGKLADTATSPYDTVKPAGDFLIGCISKGPPTSSFKGVIGAVRVYNRALSDDEIRSHHATQIKRYPKPPSRYDRMIVQAYPYLDRGKVVLDADFSYLHPRDEAAEAWVELRASGRDDPICRRKLPKLPRSGELRDVSVDLGTLEPGNYELRVALTSKAGVRAHCAIPLSHAKRVSVPAPSKKTVPALPPPPAPVDYELETHKGGGFTIGLKGDRYPVESTFSFPNGGANVLSASARPPDGVEPGWRVQAGPRDGRIHHVTGSGKYYTIDRTIERLPGRIAVRDKITNTSGADLGILLSNHVLIANVAGLHVQRLPNPSVFLRKVGQGLGMVALDDVYLEQHATFADAARAGIRSDRFALAPGASYTLEWDVYLNDTGEYYDFVNQFRKNEGYAPLVEGGFAFTDRRKSPTEAYVKARALRYASIGCLGHPADDPSLSLEGIEFTEYPKESALLKATFAETRRRFPGMKTMFHVAHSLYTTNKPVELFGDSRVLNGARKQTDYGGQNVAYYRKYFSSERVKEGYRWYIFYPTMANSFGKAMLKAVDYMLDEIGADSMFADGFTHGYGGRFTYDRWDGHTAEIDPKTKTIKRKHASVNLLAQDVLVEVLRKIRAKGGVVIANSYPGTRTVHKQKNLLYCLETAGGGKVCARLHFCPSVIALGNPGRLETARDVYDDLREKLEWGGLYFYYGEKAVPPDTIVTQMYPITVEEICAGMIKGRERIITLRSGVYGWQGADKLHFSHRYDGRGCPVEHRFLTTVDTTGVRTDVKLLDDEAAVVKTIPVTVKTATPVNVVTRRYGPAGIELVMNGKGAATITVCDGEFDVRTGQRYDVRIGEQEQECVARSDVLSFDMTLGGPLQVTVAATTK